VTSPGLCSRAALFRRYDPNVQGRTCARPGDADAGVIVPVPGAPFGLAIAVDGNPRLAALDARLGAGHAVWEAARNVVAVGAYPIALTDCLNYGRPEDPAIMAQLEDGIDGLAEAARVLGTLPEVRPGEDAADYRGRVEAALPPLPFVSGNVSLYNEDEKGSAIPPSAIVACLGRLPDVARTLSPGLKAPGNALWLVGGPAGRVRLGGSHLAEKCTPPAWRDRPPRFPEAEARRDLAAVLWLNARGLLRAVHDVSDGGAVQALLEMSFASGEGLGLACDLEAFPFEYEWYSEEPAFVVEIAPADAPAVRDALAALAVLARPLGWVEATGRLRFTAPGDHGADLDRAALWSAWESALGPRFDPREEALA
jgi:phosphoribosylformylglycinamidine synthase